VNSLAEEKHQSEIQASPEMTLPGPAATTGGGETKWSNLQRTMQVGAGRLARNISGEINAQLTVTPAGSGRFLVTSSNQFFTLSLLLAGAYYRENAARSSHRG
jgi:hypothetical protein